MTCKYCRYLYYCLIMNDGFDKENCIYEKEGKNE